MVVHVDYNAPSFETCERGTGILGCSTVAQASLPVVLASATIDIALLIKTGKDACPTIGCLTFF